MMRSLSGTVRTPDVAVMKARFRQKSTLVAVWVNVVVTRTSSKSTRKKLIVRGTVIGRWGNTFGCGRIEWVLDTWKALVVAVLGLTRS